MLAAFTWFGGDSTWREGATLIALFGIMATWFRWAGPCRFTMVTW